MKTQIHKLMTHEMLKPLNSILANFFKTERVNGDRVIDIIARGSYIEDTLVFPEAHPTNVSPWLEHYWQHNLGDKGLHHPLYSYGSSILLGVNLTNNRAAYLRATDYWNDYVWGRDNKVWRDKSSVEKERALLFLGRIIHLLEDMSTPAHTNNDIHVGNGNEKNWYDDDDFEDYVELECQKNRGRLPSKYKASSRLRTFNPRDMSIHDIFAGLARETMKYDSDDEDGTESELPYHYPWYRRDHVLDLTDWACDTIAKNLMPLSYSYGAALLIKFLNDMQINSTSTTPKVDKCELKFILKSLKICSDGDSFGEGEIIIKVVNGKDYKSIDERDIVELQGVNSGEKINLHYPLAIKSTIKADESTEVYMEVHDDDATINGFIGRASFIIDYENLREAIDSEERLSLKSNDGCVEIEIEVDAECSSKYTPRVETLPELKFYTVDIESLDREDGSWWLNLGRDDIRIEYLERESTKAILSSYETMELIEDDGVLPDDDVKDFTWSKWKNWIGERGHRESVQIAGSHGRHRIKLNIEEYRTPSTPSHIEMNYFEIDCYSHSIQVPHGQEYYTTFDKETSSHAISISKNDDIQVDTTIGGRSCSFEISPNIWHCWIESGKGYYQHTTRQGIKCNFIIFVKALKPEYSLTAYMEKLVVLDDTDPDISYFWEDCAEVHAQYHVAGNMQSKWYLGTICEDKKSGIYKRLGNPNQNIKYGDSIKFDIKLYDQDDGSENDSLGTVKIDIPYSQWSQWSNRGEHVTGFIKSSNKKCKLSFRFRIKEEPLLRTFTVNPIKKSKSVSPKTISSSMIGTFATGVHALDRSSINDSLIIDIPSPWKLPIFETDFTKAIKALPSHEQVKRELHTPLVDATALERDVSNIFFYNNNHRGRIVLHRYGCKYLINKDVKKLYLKKSDIFKIQKIKNIRTLDYSYLLRKLESEYKAITVKVSSEYVSILEDRKLLKRSNRLEHVEKIFVDMLDKNNSNKSTKIEDTQEYKLIEKELVANKTHKAILERNLKKANFKQILLNDKIDGLKKTIKSMSKEELRENYQLKIQLHRAKFCSCCRD